MSNKEKVEISKAELMEILETITALASYIEATNEKPPKSLIDSAGWKKQKIGNLILKPVKSKVEKVKPVTVSFEASR